MLCIEREQLLLLLIRGLEVGPPGSRLSFLGWSQESHGPRKEFIQQPAKGNGAQNLSFCHWPCQEVLDQDRKGI